MVIATFDVIYKQFCRSLDKSVKEKLHGDITSSVMVNGNGVDAVKKEAIVNGFMSTLLGGTTTSLEKKIVNYPLPQRKKLLVEVANELNINPGGAGDPGNPKYPHTMFGVWSYSTLTQNGVVPFECKWTKVSNRVGTVYPNCVIVNVDLFARWKFLLELFTVLLGYQGNVHKDYDKALKFQREIRRLTCTTAIYFGDVFNSIFVSEISFHLAVMVSGLALPVAMKQVGKNNSIWTKDHFTVVNIDPDTFSGLSSKPEVLQEIEKAGIASPPWYDFSWDGWALIIEAIVKNSLSSLFPDTDQPVDALKILETIAPRHPKLNKTVVTAQVHIGNFGYFDGAIPITSMFLTGTWVSQVDCEFLTKNFSARGVDALRIKEIVGTNSRELNKPNNAASSSKSTMNDGDDDVVQVNNITTTNNTKPKRRAHQQVDGDSIKKPKSNPPAAAASPPTTSTTAAPVPPPTAPVTATTKVIQVKKADKKDSTANKKHKSKSK